MIGDLSKGATLCFLAFEVGGSIIKGSKIFFLAVYKATPSNLIRGTYYFWEGTAKVRQRLQSHPNMCGVGFGFGRYIQLSWIRWDVEGKVTS